jgi:hypothetical protein
VLVLDELIDPRAGCAARVLVLAGMLGTLVLLDDGWGRTAACSRCWKAPQEGITAQKLNNGVARSGSSQNFFFALNFAR